MILFIDGHHLGAQKHGVQKFLTGLIEGISELNENTQILVGVKKSEIGELKKVFSSASVELIAYTAPGILRLVFDLPMLLKTHRVDIFYGQYFIPVFRSTRIGYFFTVHDILYESYPDYYSLVYRLSRRYLIMWSAAKAETVFTSSEYSKNQIHEIYGIHRDRIRVIPIHVAALDEQCTKDASPIRDTILYVSRFEERKNHETLIHVFSKIANSESARLVLVGFDVDGTKERCRQLVKKLGLLDKVDFQENIDSPALDELYATSKLIIYPSLCEGFGMPVLEALLVNSRVLFSNTTSMSEFTFAREHMFNPLDEVDMYNKALGVLTNPDIYEAGHDNTVSCILRLYNLANVAKQYSEFMRLA